MTAYQTLLVERSNGVALVSFNRPDKKNAMNPQLHEDMTALLEELRYDDAVRVLVLTGTGNAFCAGMDLKEVFHELKDQPARYDQVVRMATEWRGRTLRYFPKPTIAMVNGYCFGGAFSIVEGCDLAIAADEATFGLSEINFKTAPLGSVAKDVADKIAPRAGMYYALTGEPFKGQRAVEIGLATISVPLDKLKAEVRRIAEALRAKDPIALKVTKDVLKFSERMDYEEAYAYSVALGGDLTYKQDGAWMKSGIGEFMEGKSRPGLNERAKA